MRNEQHCRATRVLLGFRPNPELHALMDAYSKSMGWGHRAKRHDYAFVKFAGELYGERGRLEAALHIACDMGIVTMADVRLWQGARAEVVRRLM